MLVIATLCPLGRGNASQMGDIPRTSTFTKPLGSCDDSIEDLRLYSTIAVSGGSSIPDTFIEVDPETGQQAAIGPVGGTNHVLAADLDPVSGFLFGVNFITLPGGIERIDPQTGEATIVGTIRESGSPVPISALAFSPDGRLYGISGSPGRTLGIVDVDAGVFLPLVELSDFDYIAGIDFSPEGVLSSFFSFVKNQVPLRPDLGNQKGPFNSTPRTEQSSSRPA